MVMRNVYIKEEENQFHSKLTKHDVLISLLATFRSFGLVVNRSTGRHLAETNVQLREHLGAFFAKDDAKVAGRLADKLIANFKKAIGVTDESISNSEAEQIDNLKSQIVKMLTTWNPATDYVLYELRGIFKDYPEEVLRQIRKSADYHVILEWREVLKEKAIFIAKTFWVPSIAPESSDDQVQYCKGTYLSAAAFRRAGDAKFRDEAPPYEVLIDPRENDVQLDNLRNYYEWLETVPWLVEDQMRKVDLQLKEEYKPLWSKVFRRWCLPIPTGGYILDKLVDYQSTIADIKWFPNYYPKKQKLKQIQEALKAYQKFCDPIDFRNDDPESIYVKMHFEGVVRYVAIKPSLYQFLASNLEELKQIMNDFRRYLKSVRQYLGAPNATEQGLKNLTTTCDEIKTRFAAFATQDEVQGLPWTTFWSEALMRPLRLCEEKHAEQAQASLF